MLALQVNTRVRITRPGSEHGLCGIVIEAEDDRQVANILLDATDKTTEEDYEFLEVISATQK